MIAIVGENGAGKSTLVKLLAGSISPTTDASWSTESISRAFPPTIGASMSRARSRIFSASSFARATRSASATCRGSTTSLRWLPPSIARAPMTSSSTWLPAWRRSSARPGRDGVEVSFGQWQKLALARGFMRDHPLLLVLDEPTAALDAETEHALFERYAAAARSERRDGNSGNGARDKSRFWSRIASARCAWPIRSSCSTARASPKSAATKQLMAKGGQYAELYGIQAAAYR